VFALNFPQVFNPQVRDVEAKGLMPLLLANYMDKHAALDHTAAELTRHGFAFIAAKNLHK